MEILSGKHPVTILSRHAPAAAPKLTRSQDEALPYDETLFERLRQVRTRLAKADHLPPYMVCSDRTLRDMVRKRPTTLAEMLRIHGIGEAKLARYGQTFLDAITR